MNQNQLVQEEDEPDVEIDALILKDYISICDRLLKGENLGPLHIHEFASVRILRYHAEQTLHRCYGEEVYFKKMRDDETPGKFKRSLPYILFLISSLIIFLLIAVIVR